jgi:hypothetical protein
MSTLAAKGLDYSRFNFHTPDFPGVGRRPLVNPLEPPFIHAIP